MIKTITVHSVSAKTIPLHRRLKPKQFINDLLFLLALMSIPVAGVACVLLESP
jgi:hypothetical protein